MNMHLRLIVHSGKSIYDNLVITPNYVDNYVEHSPESRVTVRMNKWGFSANVGSAYVYLLKSSHFYRQCAVKSLYLLCKRTDGIIFMKLRMPKKQFLDYNWNKRTTTMATESRAIDNALSWMSTLGGAFSAMGDHFTACAQIAGNISLQQFRLALRLGDPLLVARCKLYAALSLIQQNKLKIPRRIIPEIHQYAVLHKDTHLRNMCLGIWAKLKYHHTMRKLEIKKNCTADWWNQNVEIRRKH